MSDIYTKEKRSELMRAVKQKGTGPEEKVAVLLRKLKIRYRRNAKSLPGSPDFVVKSAKTVIFVHGCFWHGHPNCKLARRPKTNRKFWEQKVVDNRKRDRRKERLLRKQGWHVMTIWQCKLRNIELVMNRLKRMLL